MKADNLCNTATTALSVAESLVLELIRNAREETDTEAVNAALQQIRDAAELLNSVRLDDESAVTTLPQDDFYRGALAWLRLYINTDRDWIAQLSAGDMMQRAETVRQLAHGFSIGRNFPACELKGAAKHIRTVEELEATEPDNYGDDVAALVLDLERRFRERHNSDRMMLSAASKLLWIRHPGRSVIIDNHAAKVLGFAYVGLEMYPDYVNTWRQRYAEARDSIIAAFDSMLSEDGVVPEDVRPVLLEEWFRQRAFDLYLWQQGA